MDMCLYADAVHMSPYAPQERQKSARAAAKEGHVRDKSVGADPTTALAIPSHTPRASDTPRDALHTISSLHPHKRDSDVHTPQMHAEPGITVNVDPYVGGEEKAMVVDANHEVQRFWKEKLQGQAVRRGNGTASCSCTSCCPSRRYHASCHHTHANPSHLFQSVTAPELARALSSHFPLPDTPPNLTLIRHVLVSSQPSTPDADILLTIQPLLMLVAIFGPLDICMGKVSDACHDV